MHINGTGAFGRIFNLKFYLFFPLKGGKLRINQTALMKEHFPSVCIADKPEPSLAYYFLDLSRMHLTYPLCRLKTTLKKMARLIKMPGQFWFA